MKRHEIFRTEFCRPTGVKTPYQVIAAEKGCLWTEKNLTKGDAQNLERALEEVAQEQRWQEFDLEKGPLFMASLICVEEDHHVLMICLPSLCGDSWTLKAIFSEIAEAYANLSISRESDDEILQYADFSKWQNDLVNGDDEEAQEGRKLVSLNIY